MESEKIQFLTNAGLIEKNIKNLRKADLIDQLQFRNTHLKLVLYLLDVILAAYQEGVDVDHATEIVKIKNMQALADVEYLIDETQIFIMQEDKTMKGLDSYTLTRGIVDAYIETLEKAEQSEAAGARREALKILKR